MFCCGSGGAPALRAASCCQSQVSALLAPPARAIAPPVAPAVLSAPAALPSQPAPAPRAAELPPPGPPLLHEGIGLYTLHSVFLI